MHSPEEAALLSELASDRHTVVEIGVYEGSSALVLCGAMQADADLHLIDPFVDETGWALPAGWGASARATQRVVARAGGPRVHWHVARSQDVGRGWTEPVDVVFIDGDHSPEGVREDWDVWHPHVKPGGFVAFHDARDPGLGPTQVVSELFPLPGWEMTHEVDNIVVVTRDPRPGT
jgi:predicted O-methyltransferase YrrM